MKPPLIKPRMQSTSHGKRMSERQARLWTWMQDNSIPLHSFSTDQCVENCVLLLTKRRDELDKLIPTITDDTTRGLFEDTLKDVDCILRRRPGARAR